MDEPNSDKPFECDDCHQFYKTKSSLSTHKNKVHNKKNHICLGCNSNLSSNSSLIRHQSLCTYYKDMINIENKNKQNQLKQNELEITIKFMREQLVDKDKHLDEYKKQLDEKEKQIQSYYKETINSKDKLFEVSNRSHQIQASMMSQVNSNNNINVIVQNQSDLDIARKLIPISNENLANAYLSVLNQYTDTYKKTIYNPSVFYSDLINTPELKHSVVKTDQSRNISAWINKDENNTFIKDKNARKLLLKLTEVPKENKIVNKKITEIIQLNQHARSSVEYANANKDETIAFNEEYNSSNQFFNHLRQSKKIPEKTMKLYEKMIGEHIPDRTDLLIDSKKDKETLISYSEKEVSELGDFSFMFKAITDIVLNDPTYLYSIFFCPIEDLGIIFRKLLCLCYEKHLKTFSSILIRSEQIEDRMIHTIYYSQDHEEKNRNINYNDLDNEEITIQPIQHNTENKKLLNRSQLLAISKKFFRTIISNDWNIFSEIESKAFRLTLFDNVYSFETKMKHYLMKKNWCYGPLTINQEEYIQLDHSFLDGCLNLGDYIKVEI